MFYGIHYKDPSKVIAGHTPKDIADQGNVYHIVRQQDDLMNQANFTTKYMLNVYNFVANKDTKKFRDRATAASRLYAALQDHVKSATPPTPVDAHDVAPPEPRAKPSAPGPKRGRDVIKQPQAQAKPCRAATNQAILLDAIFKNPGKTAEELAVIVAAEGFRKPTVSNVSGTASYDLCTVKGYGLKRVDGRYTIVLPEGMTAPLPHTPRSA